MPKNSKHPHITKEKQLPSSPPDDIITEGRGSPINRRVVVLFSQARTATDRHVISPRRQHLLHHQAPTGS